MKNRRDFQPACSQIETLEIRNLMSDVPYVPPVATSPVQVAPVDVVSVSVGPVSETTPDNNLSFWVTTVGYGTDSQVGLVNVITTITDLSSPNHPQVQQNISTIAVAPDGNSFYRGTIDMSSFPYGTYRVDIKAYDAVNPSRLVQDSSIDYKISAPVTTTPFFVVDSNSQLAPPSYSYPS